MNEATTIYKSNFGWQALIYPKGNLTIFNVPKSTNDVSEQHVQNQLTGGWCKFTGWNAYCFEVFDSNLYFGTSTKVCKADVGSFDFVNTPIVADIQPAFNNFGSNAAQKRFTMVRPLMISTGEFSCSSE